MKVFVRYSFYGVVKSRRYRLLFAGVILSILLPVLFLTVTESLFATTREKRLDIYGEFSDLYYTSLSGEETAELVSPHGAGPYSNGCVGVSVRQGSHLALDGIRLWPAENSINPQKHHQSSPNAAPNPENIHKTTEI